MRPLAPGPLLLLGLGTTLGFRLQLSSSSTAVAGTSLVHRCLGRCFGRVGGGQGGAPHQHSLARRAAFAAMSSSVRVSPLTPDDESRILDVTRILTDSFSQEKDTHSWGRALGRPKEGFPQYMKYYVPKQAAQIVPGNLVSLSAGEVGGEDATTGVLLMEDLCPAPMDKDEEQTPSPGMAEINALLGACEKVLWEGCRSRGIQVEKGASGKVAYFAWLAVEEGQRRKGAATELVVKGAERCKEQRFVYGVAFTTSPKSTKVFKQAGFECFGEINYQGFEFEGKRPYASIQDEVSVMVKKL